MGGRECRKKMGESHHQLGVKPCRPPGMQLPTSGDVGRLMMLRLHKMEEKKLWVSIAYPLRIASHRGQMRFSASGKGHQFRRGADIMWLKWPDSCGQRETTYVKVGNQNVPDGCRSRCSDSTHRDVAATHQYNRWHHRCNDVIGIIPAAAAAPIWHVLTPNSYTCCLPLPTTVWSFQSHDICTSSELVPFSRCWEPHLPPVWCNP